MTPTVQPTKRRLYSPPAGFYDQPFTYIYDGTGLTNGNNYRNQSVLIQRGFGDFILRRAVGWNQVVPSGSFQLYDPSLNPIQSAPIQAANAAELPFTREVLYPEQNSVIRFDLFSVQKPVNQSQAALVAFQGVRRVRGVRPQLGIPYKYSPRYYCYILPITIPNLVTNSTQPTTVVQPITDFDFDLYQIIITYASGAHFTYSDESSNFLTFTAVTPGPGGDAISITFTTPAGDNPLVVSVAGNAITIQLQTLGGTNVSTPAQVIAAVQASAAASALVSVAYVSGNGALPFDLLTNNLTGGGYGSTSIPFAAYLIYDAARSWISNAPVPDIYIDGGPFSPYQNGAIVPALHYPRSTQIRIDAFSLLTAGISPNPPVTAVFHLIGENRIPC